MEEKWIINISVKKKTHSSKDKQPVTRLERETYDRLAEISGEMGLPMKKLASELILEAMKHMELSKTMQEE